MKKMSFNPQRRATTVIIKKEHQRLFRQIFLKDCGFRHSIKYYLHPSPIKNLKPWVINLVEISEKLVSSFVKSWKWKLRTLISEFIRKIGTRSAADCSNANPKLESYWPSSTYNVARASVAWIHGFV